MRLLHKKDFCEKPFMVAEKKCRMFPFFLLFLLLISPLALFADTAGIENQISSVLVKVFDLNNFSVSVREAQYTEIVDIGKDKRNLLPGVPVEEKLQ